MKPVKENVWHRFFDDAWKKTWAMECNESWSKIYLTFSNVGDRIRPGHFVVIRAIKATGVE